MTLPNEPLDHARLHIRNELLVPLQNMQFTTWILHGQDDWWQSYRDPCLSAIPSFMSSLTHAVLPYLGFQICFWAPWCIEPLMLPLRKICKMCIGFLHIALSGNGERRMKCHFQANPSEKKSPKWLKLCSSFHIPVTPKPSLMSRSFSPIIDSQPAWCINLLLAGIILTGPQLFTSCNITHQL